MNLGNLKQPSWINISEYLNKFINSSQSSQQEKSLEENISLLKKNFCTKDEIINKLVETQSTVLNAISAKFNNKNSNSHSHFAALTKILTKQGNQLHQNSSIHLSHDPIFDNCKKYRIRFKYTTKDPAKYCNEKYTCGKFTGRYHESKHL